MEKKGNIYVCHTFYHVFVSFLKELNLPKEEQGQATLVLSSLSNDFENLADRVRDGRVFSAVYEFDEKRDYFFQELMKYKEDRGNIVANMRSRIIYTHKFAKLQEPYIPVDFRKYKDIYVFCDQDPIGIYLNQNRIRYHALEDGLNYLKPFIPAKFDNRGHFGLKKFFSMKLNLIFIRDGYSKYCQDMEVNDLSVVDDDFYKYKEVPRKELVDHLDADGREEIIRKYDAACDELGLTHLYHHVDGIDSSNHLYLIRVPGFTVEQRNELITRMAEAGVATNVHYKPLPMMTAYKALGWNVKDFPNTYDYYHNLFTLPLHTLLSDEDVDFVCETLKTVVKEMKA